MRDNHEKSGCHVYSPVSLVWWCFIHEDSVNPIVFLTWAVVVWFQGDFVESDEQFRSRPRGGLKRKCPDIETLSRKRVVGPPNESDSVVNQVPEYLSWLLSAEDVDDLH